jgi:hypothetical protein
MSKYRNRSPYGVITEAMFQTLKRLAESYANEFPFIALDGVRGQTIRALQDRDWLVVSNGLDGTRYAITGRGLKAFKIFNTPSGRRNDNMCPSCGIRPRGGFFPSGDIRPYCRECERINHNKHNDEHGGLHNPNIPCSSCKKNNRHRYSSGRASAYCKTCLKENHRREHKAQNERKLDRIRNDETILCSKCKEAPVYVCRQSVSAYCYACFRQYQNESSKRRAFARVIKQSKGESDNG